MLERFNQIGLRPKISVLIPVYNREDLLKQAVDSVLCQSYDNIEIIIADNCSSDNTLAVAQRYAQVDARIKVLNNTINLGPVGNWQVCLNESTGDLVHWLWSDDWIEPDFYADAIEEMRSKNTNILTTWNFRSDELNVTSDRYVSWCFEHEKLPGKTAAQKLLAVTNELPLSPAAWILPIKLVKKGFFTDIDPVGRYNPVEKGVGVDSLMIVHCAAQSDCVAVLRKPSVTFRSHDNISNKLGASGELTLLYSIAHLWYSQRFEPELNLIHATRLFLRACKGCWLCKRDAIPVIKAILKYVAHLNIKKVGLWDPFRSRRARFRR
jgi:glycosyltransferase involved in cell wall biosynthesis